MAPSADFTVSGRAWTLMARGAIEAHGGVRLMQKSPHLRYQRLLGYTFMAEAAVHGRCVMKAVTTSARFLLDGHGRSLVAGITTEPHSEVGIVEKASGGEGKSVAGRRIVTETASLRGIGNVMAVVAGFRRGQG